LAILRTLPLATKLLVTGGTVPPYDAWRESPPHHSQQDHHEPDTHRGGGPQPRASRWNSHRPGRVPQRTRGTIVSITPTQIVVTSRTGQTVIYVISGDIKVAGEKTVPITAIQAGSYIGSAAVPASCEPSR
jgi:hypothetical protein